MSHSPEKGTPEWAGTVTTEPEALIGKGSRWMLIGFGGFCLWAALFPIGSAVVASGMVISEGQNQLLQHRTNGVVAAIYKREGEPVRKGDIILEFDPAVDQAELTRLEGKRAVLMALKSRLEAEKRFADGTASPAGFELRNGPARVPLIPVSNTPPGNEMVLRDVLAAEQAREYETGRREVMAEMEALRKQSEAKQEQLRGQIEREKKLQRQVALLRRQLQATGQLAKQGHVALQSEWQMEAELLTREGELENVTSQRDSLRREIDEVKSRMLQAASRDQRQTSKQLTDVLGELSQISDQINAAATAVKSARVVAPAHGTLVKTKYTTIGGVLPANEPFGEVVPQNGTPTLRVRVMPQDIAYVHKGQEAEVKISAVNKRVYESLPGVVTFVAADATLDTRTGMSYFEVNVAIQPPKANVDVTTLVSSGMAGEAFIKGESRTFASYMFKPVLESLFRAFREHG
jgi:HlyD family type I secretion membrane fusion protein